jgi:hypothetical protein
VVERERRAVEVVFIAYGCGLGLCGEGNGKVGETSDMAEGDQRVGLGSVEAQPV